MRVGGVPDIGGGQWDIAVDNNKNEGGGTKEKHVVEREDVT